MVDKNMINILSITISITVSSFSDFETSSVMLFKNKFTKMPKNMKSYDRFRTVFESAVLCKLFPVPYSLQIYLVSLK